MTSIGEFILMRMFGRPVGLLGRLGGIVMAHTKEETGAWLIELLDVRAGDRILEVGFGPGIMIDQLAAAAPEVKVAGVDPSPVMLEQACRRNASHIRSDRIDLRLGSADNLPFDDESQVKAVALNSMQMWPDPLAGLREIRRVLIPGGRVALAFTPHARQRKEEVRRQLDAAGFQEPRLYESDTAYCLLARVS